MKHSKGPWEIFNYTNKNMIKSKDGQLIHEFTNCFETDKANANLIAAAPEMLEMLILIQLDGYKSKALDALIKKAKGE